MNINTLKKRGWVTVQQFQVETGLAIATISAAIRLGKIPESAVCKIKAKGNPVYINPVAAALAWRDGMDVTAPSSKISYKKLDDFLRSKNVVSGSAADGRTDGGANDVPDGISTKKSMSHAEAQRQTAVAKAAMAQMEARKMAGELVVKETVYKQLFEAGQQLRDAIMAVPNRVTAEIVAAEGNHAKIRKIMTEELAGVLEGLTDIYRKEIG